MSKNVTPTTDLVEILTQFENAINSNASELKGLAELFASLSKRIETLETATQPVTPAVSVPSLGAYRPQFGAVPVTAPKQTSPSKPSGKKTGTKAAKKADPVTPTATGTIDYAVVAAQVIENTKKGVWNENLAQSSYLIESDPRLFLTPAQSGSFRRAYKAANVKYSDAATQLATTCKGLGWEYPS